MALAAIKISKKGRRILLVILMLAHVIQSSFALVIIITGIIVKVQIGSTLHPLDGKQFHTLLNTLITFGVTLIFLYLSGMKVCYDCAHPALHLKSGNIWLIWILVSVAISSLNIALVALFPATTSSLVYQLTNSLYRGMGQYLNDPQWKATLDTMQQELNCCGVEIYTNWHSTAWINMNFLRQDSRTVQHYSHSDGRVLPPTAPWSCCNPKVLTPCFHDRLQQKRFAVVWKENVQLIEDSLFKDGCLNIIQPMLEKLSEVTTAVVIIVCLLQLLISVLSRYLYTSSRNAVMLGDADIATYGWLFGRGDCGYNHGKTLPELMKQEISERPRPEISGNETETTYTKNTDSVEETTESGTRPKFKRKKMKRKANTSETSEYSEDSRIPDPKLLAALIPK